MEHPYLYRLKILKRIETPSFELGKGCVVVLNLASKQLIKLLKAVYHKDKTAFDMSRASATYLLTCHGNSRNGTAIPCVTVPKPICFQPKIINLDENGR
jgi:hypothetical protein